MSTRSCIVIKVKESDLNQVKKFNPELLPVKVEGWDCYGETTCAEKSQPVELKGAYIGIYCHSDGYPSGVGAVLKEKFNDYETALNLIIGGDCSSVWFDSVRRYGTRSSEDWDYIFPQQGDKPEQVYKRFGGTEYCYLFEDGVGWKVNTFEEYIKDGNEEYPKPIFKEYDNDTE